MLNVWSLGIAMKHFGKVLSLVAAGLIAFQGLLGVAPASAHYHRNDSIVNTAVKAGAIGAGAGVLTSAITGKSLWKGAAVGAVVGAGSGAIYQTVRNNQHSYYGHNGYNDNYHHHQKWYANPGYRNYNPGYGNNNYHGNGYNHHYYHGRGHHYGHRY
jgi:hypothetical protein